MIVAPAGWRTSSKRAATRPICSGVSAGRASARRDRIGLALGAGWLASMLLDDLFQEAEHPGPREQVRRPEPGDGRIAPEPGADGDARKGHGISQACSDGAVRHREP